MRQYQFHKPSNFKKPGRDKKDHAIFITLSFSLSFVNNCSIVAQIKV